MVENRRQFIDRAPLRLAGLAGSVGILGYLAACEPVQTAEPRTDAEREAQITLRLYQEIYKNPVSERNYIAASLLTAGSLSSQNSLTQLLESFKRVKDHKEVGYTEFAAALTSAAELNGYSIDEALNLHDQIIKHPFVRGWPQTSNLAVAAMAAKGDLQKFLSLCNIISKDTSYDSATLLALTSVLGNKNYTEVMQLYKNIYKNPRIQTSYTGGALLTLTTILAGSNQDNLFQIYKQILDNDEVYSYDIAAWLSLVVALNRYSLRETLEIYRYILKSGVNSYYAIARLTFATSIRYINPPTDLKNLQFILFPVSVNSFLVHTLSYQ